MAKKLPEIGQGYRIVAVGLPGTGEVVYVHPANEPLSQEAAMRFYGVSPDHLTYDNLIRPITTERIVIRRDGSQMHLVLPPEIIPNVLEEIVSPRCPKCQTLSPSQKVVASQCPKCGAPMPSPEVPLG